MSKVALVTGASRGIGRATALALAARGWTVGATLRGAEGRAELLAAGVLPLRADVTRSAELLDAVDALVGQAGRLDAVVANAGRGAFGCFEDVDADQARSLFDVNVFGVFETARAALPHLRASRGRLVVIGSVAGRRSAPGSSIYNASKAALEGWAEALALELDPLGVRVVIVEPGTTQSGFVEHALEGRWVGSGPYAAITARLREVRAENFAAPEPTSVVTDAVLAALERPDPPLRVPVGRGTRAQILAAQLLPWRVYRALVRRKLRLPTS